MPAPGSHVLRTLPAILAMLLLLATAAPLAAADVDPPASYVVCAPVEDAPLDPCFGVEDVDQGACPDGSRSGYTRVLHVITFYRACGYVFIVDDNWLVQVGARDGQCDFQASFGVGGECPGPVGAVGTVLFGVAWGNLLP